MCLPSQKYANEWPHVSITQDCTKQQQEKFRKLRALLHKRKSDGEHIIMIGDRIVPDKHLVLPRHLSPTNPKNFSGIILSLRVALSPLSPTEQCSSSCTQGISLKSNDTLLVSSPASLCVSLQPSRNVNSTNSNKYQGVTPVNSNYIYIL